MAVINIGSGSVKLYLSSTRQTTAKVTLLALNDKKEEAAAETLDAVAAFCAVAKDKGEKVTIFGTEAMRSGGGFLANLILDKLGYPVDIIDGQTEARCGFLGCGGKERKTVVDVGGASSEVSAGRDIPDFCVSLKTGSVALYNIFKNEEKNATLSKSGKTEHSGEGEGGFYSRLFDYIDGILDFPLIVDTGKICLIGGTALCLAGIINPPSKQSDASKFDPNAVSGKKLTEKEILAALKALFSRDLKQRTAAFPFIEEKRALVLPYGISVIYRILKKLVGGAAYASASGLIEGYIRLKGLN